MLLKQLEYLKAVVDLGNFYEAAEKCCVSQSAISQQIQKLEEELGVPLLIRHNRTFSLTKAGAYFIAKGSLILTDVKKLIDETKKIHRPDHMIMRIGFYNGYTDYDYTEIIYKFAQLNPNLEIEITTGSHNEIYQRLKEDELDLVINDQRRAFSDQYNNFIISDLTIQIEISNRTKLSKKSLLDGECLKEIPCILIGSKEQQEEDLTYYQDVLGIKSNSIGASSLQEARLKMATGLGFLVIDLIGNTPSPHAGISRLQLCADSIPLHKDLCAFWKKSNKNPLLLSFAKFIKEDTLLKITK